MPNLDPFLARVAALLDDDTKAQRDVGAGHGAAAVAALGAFLDEEEERHEQDRGDRSPLSPHARAINDLRGLLLRLLGLPGLGEGTADDLRNRVPELLRKGYDAELARLVPLLDARVPKHGAP